MLGHLYAAQLQSPVEYPFLGLLVSGGHSIICKVNGFDDLEILGTTVDDSVGEAFDKVAKFYGLGYPGGVIIDNLAIYCYPKYIPNKDNIKEDFRQVIRVIKKYKNLFYQQK